MRSFRRALMPDFVPLLKSRAGIRHYMRTNEDGSHTFAASQDTSEIIDHNKAQYNHNDGYGPSREMRRVASIPFVLIQKWLHEEGWDAFDPAHADKLAQKLNCSDYAHLRTAPGRVSGTDEGLR